MWDSAWFDVSPFIDEAVDFITSAIDVAGGRCLVNCQGQNYSFYDSFFVLHAVRLQAVTALISQIEVTIRDRKVNNKH